MFIDFAMWLNLAFKVKVSKQRRGTYDALLFLFIVSFLPVIRQLSLEMQVLSLKGCSQSKNSLSR